MYTICFDKKNYLHPFPFNLFLFTISLFLPKIMFFLFSLNPLGPFIDARMCIGVGPYTGAWVFFQGYIPEESWLSPSWQPSIANSFLTVGGAS